MKSPYTPRTSMFPQTNTASVDIENKNQVRDVLAECQANMGKLVSIIPVEPPAYWQHLAAVRYGLPEPGEEN